MCFCICRWSDQPDTVQLHQVPHRRLTAPIKLADFDLCAPAGTPYPKEMGPAQLEVVAAGRLTGLVVWFDLHLAEGVSLTSGVKKDGFVHAGGVGTTANVVPSCAVAIAASVCIPQAASLDLTCALPLAGSASCD